MGQQMAETALCNYSGNDTIDYHQFGAEPDRGPEGVRSCICAYKRRPGEGNGSAEYAGIQRIQFGPVWILHRTGAYYVCIYLYCGVLSIKGYDKGGGVRWSEKRKYCLLSKH